MATNYKTVALEMNRLYCIGEGHLASDLLLNTIKNENNKPTNEHTDYLLFQLAELQKQIHAIITELGKWETK